MPKPKFNIGDRVFKIETHPLKIQSYIIVAVLYNNAIGRNCAYDYALYYDSRKGGNMDGVCWERHSIVSEKDIYSSAEEVIETIRKTI